MAKHKPVKLQELKQGLDVEGLSPDGPVEIVQVVPSELDERDPTAIVTVYYENVDGEVTKQVLSRDDEKRLKLVQDISMTFDASASLLRLAIEAYRIKLAHHFDPYLAVNTSRIEPFPHQITAVYERMLPKRPLRFLLADDPGAGKTIMSGLLIKELIARGDLERCLIVAPGMLVEQWQDELSSKFNLEFDIVTSDTGKSKRSNNPFEFQKHLIVRLDMLSRNEYLIDKLKNSGDWDLIVVDEAHKMSASYYGENISYTKRYKLGEVLEKLTRHFLLMTATPHNGKDPDFQLFMALVDGDRFVGRYRQDLNCADLSDIMRRLTKEELLRIDGTPLFPERIARTVQYQLSGEEMDLYNNVTRYVQNEMERVERYFQKDDRHKYVIGFALQLLQRRLASSPNAIYNSLKRRHDRLEKELKQQEYNSVRQQSKYAFYESSEFRGIGDYTEALDDDDDDFGDVDVQNDQRLVSEIATTSDTIEQLKIEVETLGKLVKQALNVKESGNDTKWIRLKEILNNEVMLEKDGTQRKLIIFTEARDTLTYLKDKITDYIGTEDAVAVIHGGVSREQRHKIISKFMHDKNLKILVANDAAGEGVNLQRAYLMVNYDLPWNPNKIEQRFGRIHRIGQTKDCYLWNLVAGDTREGDVYGRLLEKLENVRSSLRGHVFDVLGELFEGTSLKKLLLDAIQKGDNPGEKKRLIKQVEDAVNEDHINKILRKRKLTDDFIDSGQVQEVRMEMELAEAQRLQPHHVSGFFLHVLNNQLGGNAVKREKGRYELVQVPLEIRKRAQKGDIGSFIPERYERICFEKQYINQKPDAEFIAPGHPLLEAVIALVREKHESLMRIGAVMVDDQDYGNEVRVVFLVEHSVKDGRLTVSGKQQVISHKLQFVTTDKNEKISVSGTAPHLDLRPLRSDEKVLIQSDLEEDWLTSNLAKKVRDFSLKNLALPNRDEVKQRRLKEIDKIEREVKERLSGEIAHWHSKADAYLEKEEKDNRLLMQNFRRRAEDLEERLANRMRLLDQERSISTATPLVKGAIVVIPKGLILHRKAKESAFESEVDPACDLSLKKDALRVVMEKEYSYGFDPKDVSDKHCGYDILSFDSSKKSYRFIKVHGYNKEMKHINASRNEVITSLNQQKSYKLALVRVSGNLIYDPLYVDNPFSAEPKFNFTQYPFDFKKLLARAKSQ